MAVTRTAAAFDGYRALGAFRVDADQPQPVPRAADVTRLDEALARP
jgi:hypothetical protein